MQLVNGYFLEYARAVLNEWDTLIKGGEDAGLTARALIGQYQPNQPMALPEGSIAPITQFSPVVEGPQSRLVTLNDGKTVTRLQPMALNCGAAGVGMTVNGVVIGMTAGTNFVPLFVFELPNPVTFENQNERLTFILDAYVELTGMRLVHIEG